MLGVLAGLLLAATFTSQASVTLGATEMVFDFDFSSGASPPPPYASISFSAMFDPSDPVSADESMVTNVYGGANGTGLVQVRDDTALVSNGTTYGPLTTANPLFDPMLDGVFSFGLRMSTGTARLVWFKACGNVYVPSFRQICRTYTPGIVPPADAVIDTGPGSTGPGGLLVAGADNGLGDVRFWQSLAGQISIEQATTVGSALGWMYVNNSAGFPSTGLAKIAIHADAAGAVGAEMHSAAFQLECAVGGCTQAEWKGASGLNWDLAPGSYWVVVSVPAGSGASAVMPGYVPLPLPIYRFDLGGTGIWNSLVNAPQAHIGFRLLSASSPEQMLEELATAVVGVGPGDSLSDKVALAQAYYAVPDVQAACAIMTDFMNQVRAQTGKKLTVEQAAALSTDAQSVMTAMGCE